MAEWTIEYQARPWTVNTERGRGGKAVHWSATAALVTEWRQAFKVLTKEAKVPKLQSIGVTVLQVCPTDVAPDTGACYLAVKAAIDGIVDAKVIPRDTRDYVRYINLLAPVTIRGRNDSLILTIEGEP